MITYASIIKAANAKLKTQFKGIKFQTADTEEGLKRPSFRVSLDSVRMSDFMTVSLDKNLTVRIYYFPANKNKYRSEIMGIQDKLQQLFLEDNVITTDDGFIIEVFEIEFDVIDGVLHCYFDISISEDYNRPVTGESMENINIDYKKF